VQAAKNNLVILLFFWPLKHTQVSNNKRVQIQISDGIYNKGSIAAGHRSYVILPRGWNREAQSFSLLFFMIMMRLLLIAVGGFYLLAVCVRRLI
jgi:hypothetical protein